MKIYSLFLDIAYGGDVFLGVFQSLEQAQTAAQEYSDEDRLDDLVVYASEMGQLTKTAYLEEVWRLKA